MAHWRRLKSGLKNWVLPQGPHLRTLPVGIGRGIRLNIDFSLHTRLYLGLYEIELNRYLYKLVKPGYRCFDVGGSIGYDALILAKLTKSEILTFECDQIFVREIKHNIDANPRLGKYIRCFPVFISAYTDSRTKSVCLDDIAFGTKGFIPDFVKIDIEGGELNALYGLLRTLKHRKPGLIVETHSLSLEKDCIVFLSKLGYTPTIVKQRHWLKDYRPTEHNRWLVCQGNV